MTSPLSASRIPRVIDSSKLLLIESTLDEEVLEEVANGGSMDYRLWPGLLERVLSRLDSIVHNDFPKPQAPLSPQARGRHKSQDTTEHAATSPRRESSQSSQVTDKENAPPESPSSRPHPPDGPPSILQRDGPASSEREDARPAPHTVLLDSVRATLLVSFAAYPPHTVQRLAELILRPRSHYRFLGPYLRALDRVVSVSSGADSFPLIGVRSAALPGGVLANGTGTAAAGGNSWTNFLDGDDSLGGALLTPVPWLRTEQSEQMLTDTLEQDGGINGITHQETSLMSAEAVHGTTRESLRDVGALSQGELLRQEQQAGVVPGPQPIGRQTRSATARAAAEEGGRMDEEDHPHARGPGEVGVEDMGPQEPGGTPGRFDVDVALGRKTPTGDAHEHIVTTEHRVSEQRDEDDDVILTDADETAAEESAPSISS